MPDRLAAIVFSFTPPIGKTRPVKVTSPVIAKFALIGFSSASESMAVIIVHPADGPSFGVPP